MLRNLAVAPASINVPASPVSGVLAWYAADQITSPPASGSGLASWNDLSGNGQTASQGTGTDQPTYNTNALNGLPAVAFNGSSDFLSASIASTAQPVTVFAVVVGSGGRYVCGNAGNEIRCGGSNAGDMFPTLYGGDSYITSPTGFPITTWIQATSLIDGASSLIRVNGSQVVSGSPGTTALGTGVWLGCANGTAQFWDGSIAELLIYPSALSTAQMQQTEAYLSGKWGLGAGGGSQQTAVGGVVVQAGAVGRSSVI